MLLRCSGEFMYARKRPSGSLGVPWPTFSDTTCALAEPCRCTSETRCGLWLSAPCDARCAVHAAATDDVPDATVSVRSPCWARAWFTSCVNRAAYDDVLGVDADAVAMPRLLTEISHATNERMRTVAGM